MRKSPDQLGRPGGAGAGAPAPGLFSEAVVVHRRWFGDADIVVSPWEYVGCDTNDVQSATSTAPDNPGYFPENTPEAHLRTPGVGKPTP